MKKSSASRASYCSRKSKDSRTLVCRKFFYLFTCEYCFSHWVTAAFLIITRYKLLYPTGAATSYPSSPWSTSRISISASSDT